MPIAVDRPLRIDVAQLADGRPIGGLRIEKRHPQWQPEPRPASYDLSVRVSDGDALRPMSEAKL